MYTPVVKSSSLLSSPLCATSRWTANYDNTMPSMTLQASRPIPSTIEEHPVPVSICQQTTVEIHTDAPLQCSDVVVRTAVRSRPVTARQTRASVHGRTVSMPSWRPVNLDVANDSQHHHHTLRVVPPIPASATPKICLDQVEEVGACEDIVDVQEIRVSSPRTQADVARGCGLSSSAAISISLSGCATVASGRRMSHVTPDFDPPPRRCGPPFQTLIHHHLAAVIRRRSSLPHSRFMPRHGRSTLTIVVQCDQAEAETALTLPTKPIWTQLVDVTSQSPSGIARKCFTYVEPVYAEPALSEFH